MILRVYRRFVFAHDRHHVFRYWTTPAAVAPFFRWMETALASRSIIWPRHLGIRRRQRIEDGRIGGGDVLIE